MIKGQFTHLSTIITGAFQKPNPNNVNVAHKRFKVAQKILIECCNFYTTVDVTELQGRSF